MGWYNKGLNISPSLVSMTGGLGRGAKAFGDSLVDLGDDKVEKAKADALKKKNKAKTDAQAVVNQSVNPDLYQKIQDKGINPGLISFSAPKDNSKIVTDGAVLVDGKGNPLYKNKKSGKDFTISDGQARYDKNGKLIVSLPPKPKTQNDPEVVKLVNAREKLDPNSSAYKFYTDRIKLLTTKTGGAGGGSKTPKNIVPVGEVGIHMADKIWPDLVKKRIVYAVGPGDNIKYVVDRKRLKRYRELGGYRGN